MVVLHFLWVSGSNLWWEQGIRWLLFFMGAGAIARFAVIPAQVPPRSRYATRSWQWLMFNGTITLCLLVLIWGMRMLA